MSNTLIADDSAFMRAIIRGILEKEGHTVVAEAKNGLECIEKYRVHRPDVVTLDITMQQMNGIETLKALLGIDPQAKVIMVSAMGQRAIVKDAITLGAKSFVVKPFKEEIFVSALRKL